MKVFITGITGTLGTEVTRQLLKYSADEVVGYSRDEFKQQGFLFKKDVTLYLGDVRDRERLVEATRGSDIIFHFAALKHVDILESNPEESVETNIQGTRNVLFAQRINKIPRVVLSSTDKAAYPVNVYGFCKAISERLVLRNSNNVVCRYGNVLASRGSVIPSFIASIKNRGVANITSEDMTRFFIRIEDAASFIISSAKGSGGLKIPDMKAAKMTSIAQSISDLLGKSNLETRIIGTRPGEKLSECLRTEFEGGDIFSSTAKQFSQKELTTLLRPIVEAL